MIPGTNEIKHPFFFGNSVKSNYIFTDENTPTFSELIDRSVVTEINAPTFTEYHSLERKQQQEIKTRFLKFILPVSMVSLQRRTEFANRIELIILDIDNGDGLTLGELHENLKELDFNHWLYTTISHTEHHPKIRIIVEADGQMTPDLYNQCIIDLTSKLNLTIGPPRSNSNVDSTSKDVVHAMFLPAKFASDPDQFEEIKYSGGKAYAAKDIDWTAVEEVLDKLSSSSDTSTIQSSQPPMEGLSKDMINTVLRQIQHMAHDYDEWIRIGMAVHHQFGGNSEGLEVFDSWSRKFGAEKYDRDDLIKTWESFSGHRSIDQQAITFRSCFSWAMQEDWKPSLSRDDLTPLFLEIQELRDKDISHSPEEIRISLDQLAERIRYTPMAPEHREELVLEAAACAKDYSLPLTKGFFKGKFAYANVLSLAQDQAPSWCRDHIYLDAVDKVYIPTKGHMAGENNYNNMFNAIIRDSMPYDPETNSKTTRVKPSPWERALDWYHIPKVQDIRFEPGKKQIFHEKGGTFFNSYRRPEFKFKDRALWSEEEIEFINKLRDHLRWMFHDKHILTILTFLAITVFEPQTKIRWAIFLHSDAQGIGKSLFYEMVAAIMGHDLISVVKSKQLTDMSTKWKDSKKLAIIEEASVSEQVMEDLKDDISNNRMQVRSMYKDSVEVTNYVNFIFISNQLDGIKINSMSDRRYYVASSPIKNRSDMYMRLRDLGVDNEIILTEMQRNQEFGGGDEDLTDDKIITKSAFSKYIFDDLFDGIKKYTPAVSSWLLEIYHKHEKNFDRGSPRLTDEFKDLARTATDHVGDQIEEIINNKIVSGHINDEFVIVKTLWECINGKNPAYADYDVDSSVRSKLKLFSASSLRSYLHKKLGYKDLGTFQIKINGQNIRQRVMSKDAIFIAKFKSDEARGFEEIKESIKIGTGLAVKE